MRVIIILTLILTFGCSSKEAKNFKKNILGVGTETQTAAFAKIKPGMTSKEMLKESGLAIKNSFALRDGDTLHNLVDGFVRMKKDVVTETYEYKIIKEDQTLVDLVALGMPVPEVIKGAGWPLEIQSKGSAHVFFYRTGTLLIKEDELINTFNIFEVNSVSVSSYKGNYKASPIFYIAPSIEGMDSDSPEFIEVRDYVELLIKPLGKVTTNPKSANTIIFVNFGVGDKREKLLSYSTPVYRNVIKPGTTRYIGSVPHTTMPRVEPEYQGELTQQETIETFRRHLMIEAIDAQPFNQSGQRRYFWKTTAESFGSSSDFRAILPVLAYASEGYINKNSGKAVVQKVYFPQMMQYFLEVYSK